VNVSYGHPNVFDCPYSEIYTSTLFKAPVNIHISFSVSKLQKTHT